MEQADLLKVNWPWGVRGVSVSGKEMVELMGVGELYARPVSLTGTGTKSVILARTRRPKTGTKRFLYHLGLSYRDVGEFLGHSQQAVHEWYTALADLFEPEPDEHVTVVVDETKVAVEDREVFVGAALDRHSSEVIHVEVSPGRSTLDAFLFFRTILERCRGRPVIVVDRGPWYDWSLDELDLESEARRKTWGDRSIVESWFSPFKLPTAAFFDRFPFHSSYRSVDRWAKAFALIHNARC